MTILAVNLDEVRHFIEEINKVREKLKTNSTYRDQMLLQGKEYLSIKNFFQRLVRFLKYTNTIKIESCYRVRKIENDEPFVKLKDLLYPDPSLKHEDRMNNTSFRVLYTSLNEFTAMAEIRLDKSFINNDFQLTKFSIKKDLSVFKLGLFSELYLNSPRDSQNVKSEMQRLLCSEEQNSAVRGFSALECAIADTLYDQTNGYHILSSIVADAIFSENESIDAILYPSMQNRYGLNLAIKKDVADMLTVSYTSLNRLTDVYDNGFYKYQTIQQSTDCSNTDMFEFETVDGLCCYR
jgi:hypothetical protein